MPPRGLLRPYTDHEMAMRPWFEDELFWQDCYGFLFPDLSFQMAPKQVEQVIERTGVSAGDVLDLCCGPGRHAISLAQRGFHVTGVDRSTFLLDHATERATRAGLDIEFVCADMRNFRRPDRFDLAVNLSNSFGYFDDRRDDRRVLENLHASLRPGGRLLIEMMCTEWLAKVHSDRVLEQADGSLCLMRYEIADDWSLQRNQWLVIRGDALRQFSFTLQIYSGREVKQLLADVGFVDLQLYGDLDGRPFAADLNRLVAVARKPSH